MVPEANSKNRALVCIPTYNEAENIKCLIPAIKKAIPGVHILVIDDNSPDGTAAAVKALARVESTVHLLQRAKKLGLGSAYLAGFAWALDREYDYIFEFDADLSHNPEYLPQFLSALERDEADVVIGSRLIPGGGVKNWGIHRRVLSRGGNLYANIILGTGIRDLTGGFNGYKRRVLESIDLEGIQSSGYCFQIELKYKCLKHGFLVHEIPIIFPDRTVGRSKMNLKIFAEAIWQVIALKLRFM
ncbi:MAG: polyprenol monophosphomannose synthase [Deltaproteobacteria bacterium]|nr:polyprenol monophosphomannose synthase [Deltaproteobacteria bacterium]